MRAIEQRKGNQAAELMRAHIQDATALLMNERTKQREARLHQKVMQTTKPIQKHQKRAQMS
jgi:GntR family transcriptional repressor for pyruvate dehydrogenase complex